MGPVLCLGSIYDFLHPPMCTKRNRPIFGHMNKTFQKCGHKKAKCPIIQTILIFVLANKELGRDILECLRFKRKNLGTTATIFQKGNINRRGSRDTKFFNKGSNCLRYFVMGLSNSVCLWVLEMV